MSVFFKVLSLVTYVVVIERLSYACKEGEEPKYMEYQFLYVFLKKHCGLHSTNNQPNLGNPG